MATEALTMVRAKLRAQGFMRHGGDIYTIHLATDIVGWLGLNTATQHYPAGQVEVNPVVGVRHQVVERRVAELSQRNPHNYIPPTISTPVGYVMPEGKYRAWVLSVDTDQDLSDELVSAVVSDGCGFMRTHGDPLSILDAMDRGLAMYREYSRPVLLELLGRREEALRDVETELQARIGQQGQAVEEFRRFAAAFRGGITDR